METIDDAHVRYRIEEANSSAFWAVRGAYTGTDFKTIEGGGEEERLGPFTNYEDAKIAWRTKGMETIDDAHVRYRIENI